MRLLLDTQVFLWFISADSRLPAEVRRIIRNFDNEVYLSVVSVWEAIVKYQLGKLPLPQTPESYLPLQRQQHEIASLSLDEASVVHLASLPSIHRDPFDLMLICQALQHDLIIVTADEIIEQYPVSTLERRRFGL